MGVTATHLTSGTDETDQATYTTASISPSANKLVLAWVMWAQAGNPITGVPSITGAGMTWTQEGSTVALNSRGGALFRGLSSSPSSGALSIAITSTTPTWAGWTVAEFDNVDITGSNGANAVVQSVTNSTSSGTSLTVTLAAFSSTDNATYGAIGVGGGAAITQGTGFTEVGESDGTSLSMETQFKDTNDTSVDWTQGGGADVMIAAAVEIKFVQRQSAQGIIII